MSITTQPARNQAKPNANYVIIRLNQRKEVFTIKHLTIIIIIITISQTATHTREQQAIHPRCQQGKQPSKENENIGEIEVQTNTTVCTEINTIYIKN